MSTGLAVPVFCVGLALTLGATVVFAREIDRAGERLRVSEGLHGILTALGADAPEISTAIVALVSSHATIGVGVVVGSNVFNLAALLGLGAVVAGAIALHRNVVLLGGVVGVWVAAVCLVTVLGLIPVAAGLIGVLAVLVPYIVVLGAGGARLRRFAVTRRWEAWLAVAVSEEEEELSEVIHPRHGRARDIAMAAAALVIVVGASVAMERAATQTPTTPPSRTTLRCSAMAPATTAPRPRRAARLNTLEPITTPAPTLFWCSARAVTAAVISGASPARAATTPSSASDRPIRSPIRSSRVTSR